MLALTLALTLFPTADPKQPPNPRQVAEKYLAAALSGKSDDAVKFAKEGKSPAKPKTVSKLAELVGAKKLALPTVLLSDKKGYAIAVSEEFPYTKKMPDGAERGVLCITLEKNKDGVWLVKDLDLRSATEAAELLKKAKKLFEDGKELPPTKS